MERLRCSQRLHKSPCTFTKFARAKIIAALIDWERSRAARESRKRPASTLPGNDHEPACHPFTLRAMLLIAELLALTMLVLISETCER